MDPEQLAKIDAALSDCLTHCAASDRPYTRLTNCLEALKANPSWTDAELVELQTRVIRVLLYQQRAGSEWRPD